jgi:hypothetical protein
MEEVMWSSGAFWQQAAAILAAGLLFGGMTLFSMGFAVVSRTINVMEDW